MAGSPEALPELDSVEVAIAQAARESRAIAAGDGWGTVTIVIKKGRAEVVRAERTTRIADLLAV